MFWCCPRNEHATRNRPFGWTSSVDVSGIRSRALRVARTQSGLRRQYLWCRSPKLDVARKSSPSRLCQLPRGSVARTHAPRITAYAKDFLTPSGSTISDPAPTHPQSVSPWPLSDSGGQLSAFHDASVPILAERHMCKRRFALRDQFALLS